MQVKTKTIFQHNKNFVPLYSNAGGLKIFMQCFTFVSVLSTMDNVVSSANIKFGTKLNKNTNYSNYDLY